MNCWDAEQLFDAYLDGQLSATLRLELDAHRLRCSRCRQALAMMDACVHVMAHDDPPALSDDFTSRVMAAIGERQAAPVLLKPAQGWFTPARRRIAFAAMAQAAAVVLFVSLWPGTAPSRPIAADPGSHAKAAAAGDRSTIDLGRSVNSIGSVFSAMRASFASDAGGWVSAIGGSFSMPPDVNDALRTNPIACYLIGLAPLPAETVTVATDEGSL